MSKAAVTTEKDPFFDIWRRIPPEEKLELMSRAHSVGVASVFVVLVVCGVVAVGLKIPFVFWIPFAAVPFIFQFASSKAWRGIKPRRMLEYLAARSASRRYAFGTNAEDLSIRLMFRGILSPIFEADEEYQELEAEVEDKRSTDVWIALFTETIVMISEQPGGARLEFAHTLDEKLTYEATGFDRSLDQQRAVLLAIVGRDGRTYRYRVTSRYPAALLAFERQIRALFAEKQVKFEKNRAAYSEMLASKADTDYDIGTSFDDI
jgi:hypothetical protein